MSVIIHSEKMLFIFHDLAYQWVWTFSEMFKIISTKKHFMKFISKKFNFT